MEAIAKRLGAELQRRLFRYRGTEATPIILDQRRVFVLPTRAGLAFSFTVALLLVGSINYFLSLGYLLTFLLGGLGIVAIVHTFRNLVRLEIAAGRCDPVFAGGVASFPLRFGNARADPRLGLRVCALGIEPVVVDVPARANVEARVCVPAPERGWLALSRLTLQTTFPLGLIRAWSYIHPDMRCLIYPRPERGAPPLPSGGLGERGPTGAESGGEDFAGLRGHQPADSPRHVAWKVAARDGPLLTKRFTAPAGGQVRLDWSALPAHLDTEARLSRLTAWVAAAHAAQVGFSLELPGASHRYGKGEAHVRRCLRSLALFGESRIG
ncbi:MAG: DUF58 domain-containing protein [Rhodocyclaceae bacterium]